MLQAEAQTPQQDDSAATLREGAERADASVLEASLAASGDVFYEWDLVDDRLSLAGRAAQLFGVDAALLPARGAELNIWIHIEDLPRRLSALAQHLAEGRSYDCQYRLCTEDGGFRWVHDCGAAVPGPDGRISKIAGSLRLVSLGGARGPDLAQQVLYDPATGGVQRQPLHQALDRVLAAGERSGWSSAVAVLSVDSDDPAGEDGRCQELDDALLLEMGRRLDRHLRGGDVIGRLSGRRFGLLLGRCDEAAARRTLERIVEVLQRDPVHLGDGSVAARVAAGYVLVPAQARNGLEALSRAESALSGAAGQESAPVVPYRAAATRRDSHAKAVQAADDVREALRERRLCLAYQPVVQAGGEAVRFHECLLRRRDPGGQVTAAGAFIAQVEPLGLMGHIDRHVLELALAQLDAHPGISLALNISGLTASDPAWFAALSPRLAGRPDLGERLIVEITETASLHDLDEAAAFVRKLQRLGVRVAIDDFGAGCTSVRHLTALAADLVKIDAAFSAGIRNHPRKQVFVRRLIDLARRLGMTTVAEGVESEADAAFLGEAGFDLLQGFHFGAPTLEPAWQQAG